MTDKDDASRQGASQSYVGKMDINNEIREFLKSRRARLSPSQVGLPEFGGRRRVDGLRREEVALVAGISVEYYVRLERGNATGVSESVLEGISRALQLDDDEHAHLYALVRASNARKGTEPRKKVSAATRVPLGIGQLMAAMNDVAVLVQNGRGDVVGANQLGRTLYSEMFKSAIAQPNFGRFVFLNPKSRDYYLDWDGAAHQTVAMLRAEAGRSPRDRALSNLVGELSTQSSDFRQLWAAHNVRTHRTGEKNVHHPLVGDIALSFEGLQVTSTAGLLLMAYTAQPGSESAEKLQFLANWSATEAQIDRNPESGRSTLSTRSSFDGPGTGV